MADDILDLIRRYESGGRNVPNYMYDPTHTAQGFYQITNTNWRNYAPKAGVDISQYPNAMAAPEDIQRKVANHLLTQTPSGVKNWSNFNPKLKAALSTGADRMAQLDFDKMSDEEFSKLSDEQLRQYAKQKGYKLAEPKVQAPLKAQGRSVFDTPAERVLGTVRDWSTSPEQPGIGGTLRNLMGVVPGAKQITRGLTAPDESIKSRAADVIEGTGTAVTPAAILSGGALAAPELMGGRLLGAARAASPFIKGFVGSEIGSTAAGKGSEIFTEDPESQRLARDIGGLVGSGAAGIPDESIAKTIKNPKVQAAAIGLGGAALGHPAIGAELAGIRLGLPSLKSRLLKTGIDAIRGEGEKAAPKGPVKDPVAEAAEKRAKEERDRQAAREKEERTRQEARAKEERDRAERQAKEARDRAEKAASQRQEKGPIITPVPDPQSTTGAQSVSVSVPPNARVQFPSNQGPIPTGTGMPQPPTAPVPPGSLGTVGPLAQQPPRPMGPIPEGTGMPPSPNPPIPPGSMGTVGPLQNQPPRPQGPIIQGTGLPQATQGPQPIPSPGLGPVSPPGATPPIKGPAISSTPLGTIIPRTEAVARSIADAAFAKRIPPPRTSNKAVLKGFSKKIGLDTDITGEEAKAARDIYDNRIRAARPTAEVPGK